MAVHHAVPYIHGSTGGIVHLLLTGFTYGHYAVDVFITLSGFCLAIPIVRSNGVLRGGTWGFLKRRGRRILPPYYASLVICLILIATLLGPGSGTNWDIAANITARGVAAAVLLIQDVFVWSLGGQINYPFWSVAIEWHIYFLFPILLALVSRLGRMLTITLFVVIPIVVAYRLRFTGWAWFYFQFIGLFSMGIAAAHLSFSADHRLYTYRHRIPWALLAICFAACAIAMCIMLPEDRWTRSWPIADGVCGAATVCVLVHLNSDPPHQVMQIIEWRPLVRLGEFSYSLYLVHAPVLQLVWLGLYKFWPWTISNVTYVFISVPVCLGCSWLFHLAFERPFMRTPSSPALVAN